MFPGATFNYAEHVLRGGDGRADDDLAVVFRREPGRHLIVVLTGLRRQSRPCDADARLRATVAIPCPRRQRGKCQARHCSDQRSGLARPLTGRA
jgi:hypothetical protein